MTYILDGGPQTGGLREHIAPVITLHTSQNAPGTRNLALAVYIRDRRELDDSYGGYHSISDCHGDGMQLAGLSLKVWHAPAVNSISLSHSFVTRAEDWKKLSKEARERILRSGAERCHRMSRWCVSKGVGPVQARIITEAQAKRGVSGFTTHAIVQSRDRTDPGKDFPLEEFFGYYREMEGSTSAAKPAKLEKDTPTGWCFVTKDTTLNVAPLSSSRKVREALRGERVLIAGNAESTQWWIQVGDYWIPKSAIKAGVGSANRTLFHGNFPDRAMPVNGTRTAELDLAWAELLFRIGAHKGSPYRDLHAWLGSKGVGGPTELRRQRFLAARGYYKGAHDGNRGPITIRAEKRFLNDQREFFTPSPASAMPKLRGYAGKVY